MSNVSSFLVPAVGLLAALAAAACSTPAPTAEASAVLASTMTYRDPAYQNLRRAGATYLALRPSSSELVELRVDGTELGSRSLGHGIDSVYAFEADAAGNVAGVASLVRGDGAGVVRQNASGDVAFTTQFRTRALRETFGLTTDIRAAFPIGDRTLVVGDTIGEADLGCMKVRDALFVTWLDAEGKCVQAREIGRPPEPQRVLGYDNWERRHRIHAVVQSASGAIGIVGEFDGRIDLGDQTFASGGSSGDGFAAVFEPDGTPRFATTVGGDVSLVSAAFDPTDDALVVGGSVMLSSVVFGTSLEGAATFFASLDASGKPRWVQHFADSDDRRLGVHGIDGRGRVLVRVLDCEPTSASVTAAPSTPSGTDATCVGLLDAATGDLLSMQRFAVWGFEAQFSDAGFVVGGNFRGHPDLGGGRLSSGQSFLAHFEVR